MRKIKSVFVFTLMCLMFCLSSATTVFAASKTQDGLEVVFNAEKKEIKANENIKVALSVKNNNAYDVKNVHLKDIIPTGYSLGNDSKDTLDLDKISAGQTASLSAEYILTPQQTTATTTSVSTKNASSSPKTGDDGIAAYIIFFTVSGALLILCVAGKKKTRSIMSLLICMGIIGTVCNCFIDTKAYAAATRQTKSITLSETVMAGKSEIALTATVTYDFELPDGDNLTDDIIDLGDIQTAVNNGKADVIYNEHGDIVAINGNFTDKTVNNEEDAAALLNSALPLFGEGFSVNSSNITLQSINDPTGGNENFYKYSPVVNDVPVIGSQIVVATDKNGNVTSLNSTYRNNINQVDTHTQLTSDNVQSTALQNLLSDNAIDTFLNKCVTDEHSKSEVTEEFKKSLDISSNLVINNLVRDEAPRLVYQVKISTKISGQTEYPEGFGEDEEGIEEGVISFEDHENSDENNSAATLPTGILVDKTYLIYANGDNCGKIFSVINNIQAAKNYSGEAKDLNGNTRKFMMQGEGKKYWLRDAGRNIETYKATYGGFLWMFPELPGKIATDSTTFGLYFDKAAISVHANMTDIYDYYKNILGRQSFDGKSCKTISTYDFDNINLIFTGDYDNAFWSSDYQQFVFGDGGNYTAAKDIVGHEFTHAVINYVVGDGRNLTLTYLGETGALNEAYADILGSIIEGKSKTDPERWQIGEDIGEACRDMSNPSAHNQPDNYSALSDPTWLNSLNNYQDRDNEGVHIFNSVFTFASYKMMTDVRTSSISDETWAKIFYKSLQRLTVNANFLDARGAVLCAAKNEGLDHEKQQAIKDAFDAVGITEPDSVRIVLTWGANPHDLDSHLVGPGVDGTGRFHIYFRQRTYFTDGSYNSASNIYSADLDYDDTTSYGPEVTTIHSLTPGSYYFYIHDYSNKSRPSSTAMAKSNAQVKVFRGNSSVPTASYTINAASSGIYWNVFKLTIDSGKNVTIEELNTYGTTPAYS